MIRNLFSIFDPSNTSGIRFGWISLIIFFIIYSPRLWIIKNKNIILINWSFNSLTEEFKAILRKKKTYLITINLRIFIFILYNNFIGLLPYIFNSTSHISITLTLALPLWLAINIYGWAMKTNYIFAHIVPQSTPSILIPFIVIIETIRSLIRPITLSIRLTANIIAGHLLINLLGRQIAVRTLMNLIPLITAQLILSTLEIAVSVIQAYVFTILITLYINEIPTN